MNKIYQKNYPGNKNPAKGVFGGLINNFNLKRRACQSASVVTGFTLIELLVVVLIIGILAAVALPQYELAVEKARAAEAWPVLRSMATAVEVYSLTNGGDMSGFQASNDKWSLLDISLPLSSSGHGNAASQGLKESDSFTYSLESPNYVRAYRGSAKGSAWSGHDYDLFLDLNGKQWSFSKKGDRLCGAVTAKGETICKAFGGSKVSGDKYIIP